MIIHRLLAWNLLLTCLAPAQEAAHETQALKNTIRWATASEVSNFGFDVYRSESEEGPFEKINAEPIPGAGTIDTPQHYEYVDDTIEAGVVYYYYVESISMAGIREAFTPIFPSKPKGVEATSGGSESE